MEGEGERELGMQQKHRQHIMKNMENLIRCTNYTDIVNETVRRGLISQVMRHNIEDINGEQFNMTEEQILHELHRNFFTKITKRGPTAYAELIAILRKLGYTEALHILEGVDQQTNQQPFVSLSRMNSNKSTDIVDTCVSELPGAGASASSISVKPNDSAGSLVPFTASVPDQRRVVIKSSRIHTDKILDTYPMKSQHNRGVLLIVNIIDFLDVKLKRNGAEGDGYALIHIFREIGFQIFYYENLDKLQFFETLQALTNSHYVRDTECFVMALMTHGKRVGEVDIVEFSDGSVSNVRAIINHFHHDVCPNLLYKPKVLIFPFCRGDTPDHGKIVAQVKKMHIQTDGVPYHNAPTLSDVLICYASAPGFETHRDPVEGSWYIQKLCDMIADHAHDTSLEDILKKTHELVGKMRTGRGHLQTGAFDNIGFSKKLFFNPGFYSL